MAGLFKVAAEAEEDGGLPSDSIRNALTNEIAFGVLVPTRPRKRSGLPVASGLPARRCGKLFGSSSSAG
ncbi:hypothetical protein SAMN05216338_1009167 [Bradyrhizobium sp. Rc2d]|nr:hypothetical protein SAMN05216338_1009167 [Bradyrhizobium sp. Rc2d]